MRLEGVEEASWWVFFWFALWRAPQYSWLLRILTRWGGLKSSLIVRESERWRKMDVGGVKCVTL
jgi:hypothetical protein